MVTKKIFLGAFGYLSHHASYLAKVLRIPFILYVILNFAGSFVTSPALIFVITMVSVWLQATLAIITHRVILTGSAGVTPGDDSFRWGVNETRFVMYMMMFISLALPAALLAALSPGLGIAAGLASIWLVCRWSLVFPALAVDHDAYFGKSMQMTEKYQLDMFIVVVLFPGLLLAMLLLLAQIPGSSILISILAGFFIVVQAAVLSVIYKIIYEAAEGPM